MSAGVMPPSSRFRKPQGAEPTKLRERERDLKFGLRVLVRADSIRDGHANRKQVGSPCGFLSEGVESDY